MVQLGWDSWFFASKTPCSRQSFIYRHYSYLVQTAVSTFESKYLLGYFGTLLEIGKCSARFDRGSSTELDCCHNFFFSKENRRNILQTKTNTLHTDSFRLSLILTLLDSPLATTSIRRLSHRAIHGWNSDYLEKEVFGRKENSIRFFSIFESRFFPSRLDEQSDWSMSNYSLFIHAVYPLIFSLDVVQIKHFQIDRFISTGWINTDLMTSSTKQAETIAPETSAMDTSADVVPATTIEEKPVNGAEEEVSEADNKVGKRKRATKKPTETEATNVSVTNERPKRNLSKRKWHSANSWFDLNMHYRWRTSGCSGEWH